MQSVGLAAVERVALGIYERTSVLRAFPDHFLRHRGCDAGGVEEEKIFRIEIEYAIFLELIAAADEWRYPRAVGINGSVLHPRLIGKSAGCGIAHGGGLDKYLSHASIGCEGFAF